MKINKLELDNFRAFENACLKLDGKSAVLFGVNGTGKSSVLIFHPDHRIFCQSVTLSNAKVSSFRNELQSCLNKQIYLATLAELANDTSDSVIPMILQPSHKGWHQKLFSLRITFYKVKIEKLYPGSVQVPRDGMNALGSRRSHNSGRICNLDSHLAHIMEGTCAEELWNFIKTSNKRY